MSDQESWPVKVFIYDISKGMARSLSRTFLGKHIEGVWHTGIVVYGEEFYFGGTGGIEACSPGGTVLGQPDSIVDLGNTQIPYEVFLGYLNDLSQSSFRPSCYHLLDHNCNTFSSELAQFLTGNDIPSYITALPGEVLSTPLGQMLKPWIDAMSVNPSGGHALFPAGNSPVSQNVPPTNTFLTETSSKQGTGAGSQPSGSQQQAAPTGATSQSPTGSQGSDSPGNLSVDSERESRELEPIIYQEERPSKKPYLDDLRDKLSAKEVSLVSDIYDYLETSSPSWSLCREHVQTIHTVIGDGRMGDQLRGQICVLLQDLVLIEDFIELLQNEPTKLIYSVLLHFKELTEKVQMSLLKVLTNCASFETGHRFLTDPEGEEQSNLKLLCPDVCVGGLLHEDQEVFSKASSLVYNLCRYQIPEDTQVEIGSAILECLQKDLPEITAYNLMTSLLQLMRSNEEMCDLAGVVGMNCSAHQKLSPRLRNLCEEAQTMTAL
ncbi:uncharacterized protein LOC111121875 isoform X1 [Crassostrea virginica]|uniref:Uncharacterized protein LOC111121875 isoform X2 n=1 Tax=Crassostrea virginica TaxID=6565 RepID=A0A8B8CX36_CRAVI|nr:uncharacterized protein LOC111121875 isoform X2 [Crassostrea virginica]